MKRRRPLLHVEELEGRVLLSTVNPLFTTSTNWSGYAIQTNLDVPQNRVVTAVGGTWVVPTVTGSGTAYSAVWVGLDGYSSNTVEQIGTEQDILNGEPVYYAWFEMYPRGSVNIPVSKLPISPGDSISAEVSYHASVFTLQMTDTPINGGATKSYKTTQTIRGSAESSAEWIVEAPSGYNVLPLANFSTVSFTNSWATVNGKSGPIDSSSGQSALMNMVAYSGYRSNTSPTLDSTGTLTDAAALAGPLQPPTGTMVSSFSVTYTDSSSSTTHHGHGSYHSPSLPAVSDLSATPPTMNVAPASTLTLTPASTTVHLPPTVIPSPETAVGTLPFVAVPSTIDTPENPPDRAAPERQQSPPAGNERQVPPAGPAAPAMPEREQEISAPLSPVSLADENSTQAGIGLGRPEISVLEGLAAAGILLYLQNSWDLAVQDMDVRKRRRPAMPEPFARY